MKLTKEQIELNRKQIARINNWKKVSGKSGFWITALCSFAILFVIFMILWILHIVVVYYRGGNFEGAHDIWAYLFAAFKISSPPASISHFTGGWRFFTFIIFGLCATLLTPFLTAAITHTVNRYINDAKEGRKVYKDLYGHYVLIGYNRFAVQILRHILKGNDSYVIVLTIQNPIQLREALENELEEELAKRVIFYAGDALTKEKVGILRLQYAEKLYLLDESDKHSSQYTRNLSVLQNIVDDAANRTEPLEVYMQVNNSLAYNLLQRVDIPNEFFKRNGKNVIDFRPFNFYENWARLLWSYHVLKDENGLPVYEPLDFEPIENTDKHVHLVVSNFNSMGRALLLEAIRLCHYPNFDELTMKNKTIITVFDVNLKEKLDGFFAQYPNLMKDIIDINIDFQSIDINSKEARKQIECWAHDEFKMLTIAICDKNADTALTNALNLPESVFYQKNKFEYIEGDVIETTQQPENLPNNKSRVRVLVRQEQEDAINIFSPAESMLRYGIKENASYPHIKFFGMLKDGISIEQLDDSIAICINGIYADESAKGAYYTVFHMSETNCMDTIKSICSKENKEHHWYDLWRNLSENMKWSNRFQADMYGTYISILSRIQKLPSDKYDVIKRTLPDMEHRRWCAERIVAGWRQKDIDELRVNERRIHKSIIPYNELSEGEKIKDFNVIATAKLISDEAKKLY